MTFRARLAFVAAAAVALAVVVASFVVYFVVRSEVRGPIDDDLRSNAAYVQQAPPDQVVRALFHFQSKPGSAEGYFQVVKPDGSTLLPLGKSVKLPVNDQDLAVARGERGTFLRDVNVADTHFRMITFPVAGVAVQGIRSLTEADHTLGRVENFLILIGGLGIAIVATLLMWVILSVLGRTEHHLEGQENLSNSTR